MGTEDVKVTAMNMYKYKERLRLNVTFPCNFKHTSPRKVFLSIERFGFAFTRNDKRQASARHKLNSLKTL